MKKKMLLNLFAILIGVLMCFGFNQVHAEDSNFGVTNITRENLREIADANALTTNNETILGILKERASGDSYTWSNNETDNANTAWKIVRYQTPGDLPSNPYYGDLYYCLNASKGFDADGDHRMDENASATYNMDLNMKDLSNQNEISNAAGGNLGANYNKILWILDNIYIPGKSYNEDKSKLLKKAFDYLKGQSDEFKNGIGIIPRSFWSNIKDDMIDTDTKQNLTDEDIEVAQQMAIWYFTNEGNQYYHLETGTLPPMYLNGTQIRGQGSTISGTSITTGAIREWKMNVLFIYLINNASSTYTPPSAPEFDLKAEEDAKVEESGDYFVAGPFELTKDDGVDIKELNVSLGKYTLSSIKLSNDDYLIVNEISSTDNITDYNSLRNFYVKVKKEKVTSSTTIKVSVTGRYTIRGLNFYTNVGYTNQPVVLVKPVTHITAKSAYVDINITEVKVRKYWDDEENQDGKRPNSIKVQLYKTVDGTTSSMGDSYKETLSASNEWKKTWSSLLAGTYTVKELKPDGTTAIADGGQYNNDYTVVTYKAGDENNETIIENKHIPEKVSVEGTKTWKDNGNRDGKRPDSITVKLLADGELKESKTVTGPDWTYKFENLPKYKNQGTLIKYTVDEENVPEYAKTISGYNIENEYTTEVTSVEVEKAWSDSDDQDKLRPASIEVQLYKTVDGTKKSMGNSYKKILSESNSWKDSWDGLYKKENGQVINYSVEETSVPTGYEVSYNRSVSGNKTTILVTNTHTIQLKPDLALRKYITKVGSNNITDRIPQISDTDKLDGDDAANHTAIYKHPKNPLEVKKRNFIEYSITIYNEGKVPARASKITDQIPEGLIFKSLVWKNGETQTYEKESYDEESNILVLKETSSNNDLDAFEKGKALKSTTVVVKCEVKYNAKEEVNLVNIAWISEMKKGNETFTADIDSQTTTNPECDKNSHDYSRQELNNTGYFPGQQDDDDYERVIIRRIPVEDGELKLKLIKVDEGENKITSSEAKFDITEANNTVNKTTASGELNLGTKTLENATFEYIYTIKETEAPTGYELVNDELSVKVSGTVKVENNKYVVDTIELKDKDGNDLDTSKIKAEYDSTSNTVIIKVKDKKIENGYSVKLLKVNQDGTQALEGAKFKISTSSDMTGVEEQTISKDGKIITSGKISSEDSIEFTCYIQETQAPEGYIKDETVKEVKIKAGVELKDGQYKLKNVRLDPAVDGIELAVNNNDITIKVKNNPEIITGKYKVVVKKVDSTTGEVIPEAKGAKFKINNTTYTLGQKEIENRDITSANDINLQYSIEETKAPTGYDKIEGTKTAKGTLKIVKDGTSWKVNRLENVQVDDNIEMVQDSSDSNTIIIKIKDNPIKKDFDLALRKFITAVNDKEFKNEDGTYVREPKVDETALRSGNATTATYKHTKFPVSVQKGDVVTYTIRVYNESKELSGYVDEISDHLPDYLAPIINGVDGIDETKYAKELEFNQNRLWETTIGSNTVKTRLTAKNSATLLYDTDESRKDREDKLLLLPYEGRDKLDYIDVQIKCLVKDDKALTTGTYLTNIAEIVDAEDINGEHWDGKDSALDGLKNGNKTVTETSDLNNYKNTEALASTTESYIEGQEDDDDFEKLVIESFDLALRKFAIAIKSGDKEVELKDKDGKYTREPQVDTSKLGVDGVTTATYTHDKTPIIIKNGDIVTYVLRVYNEGTLPGYATEVFDYIPEGLEFIDKSESSINNTYGWEEKDGKIVTTYLADKEIDKPYYTGQMVIGEENNNGLHLNFEDVQVQFKVTADPKTFTGSLITNWAEIGKDSNNDIDSTPGNNEKEEDDIDYEPLELGYFDLALRKFITKVNEIDYNNRAPEVDTSKLGTLDENGKKITTFVYNHTKDPVVVETGSIVVYTIRVYNEGSISGYAYEITDNIPEGLEFLPDNKINKEDYKWKMLDAEGNVTEDVTKAKKITTAYLANDIIDAYKKEDGTEVISFKDVKVAFKVTEPGTSNRLVINTAEISKASDKDIDSTPGNDDLSEDDIDREYLKVKYFDLALKKWVTATKVIYNGKTKTTKTGFNEDSTGIAKVDLVAKRLKQTTVKFVYKIKVINEGEVAGYATEIEDYIPKGLKFVQADNPKWKLVKDNVAVTDQLKDVLLEPGQSETIEIVLTWKNGASNMGLKTNWAEIKSDSGDDIDSTPDNDRKEEDDEDNAKVILSIKTGSVQTYILLVLASVAILGGGTFLIKKYVVK